MRYASVFELTLHLCCFCSLHLFCMYLASFFPSIPVEPHEAVPEVSKGKVHITQNMCL